MKTLISLILLAGIAAAQTPTNDTKTQNFAQPIFKNAQPVAASASTQPRFTLGYNLLTAATFAATFADIESSRSCLRSGACREANPFMAKTTKGQYAVNIPVTLGFALLTWKCHQPGKWNTRIWWMADASLIGFHTFGAIHNSRFHTSR